MFVGSGIFKSGDAAKRARAIVQVSVHTLNAVPPAVATDLPAGSS